MAISLHLMLCRSMPFHSFAVLFNYSTIPVIPEVQNWALFIGQRKKDIIDNLSSWHADRNFCSIRYIRLSENRGIRSSSGSKNIQSVPNSMAKILRALPQFSDTSSFIPFSPNYFGKIPWYPPGHLVPHVLHSFKYHYWFYTTNPSWFVKVL